MNVLEGVIPLAELGRLLAMPTSTLYDRVHRGVIPATKIGTQYYVRVSDLPEIERTLNRKSPRAN